MQSKHVTELTCECHSFKIRFMNNLQKQATIKGLVTGLFIFLFAYTAVSKLVDLDAFQLTLHQSSLIENKARLIARLLPMIELAIVFLLLLPNTRQAGIYVATSLMLLFTFYVLYMLITESKLPCSCGGIIGALSWKAHLLLNAFFSGLGIFQIIYRDRSRHRNQLEIKQDKLLIAQ